MRAQRKHDLQVARRRELRRAQLHAGPLSVERERHAFACAFACLECGYLELPRIGGDPMRTDRAGAPTHACPSCRTRTWLDLAEVSDADALREHERREIALRGGIALSLCGAVGSLLITSLGVLGWIGSTIGIMTGTTIAIGMALFLFTMRHAIAGLSTPRRSAVRWRAPVRRWRSGRVLGDGPAHGIEKRAPISGRTCIGWRVEVRYPGDRGDAFALIEQDCEGLAVANNVGEPTLATAACEVRADTAEAKRWLSSRGIDPHDRLEIVERLVHDGDALVVRANRLGVAAIVVGA
ncbi:MAG TPA: hypothetical protein VG755_34370 [Nannocystaceae bacterium]|nr:hypothetical protein [Nannocystaceae bacterium]